MTLSAHPFERWPQRHRTLLLWIVGVLALLPIVMMFVVTPLHEDETGGKDIVSFEFASSAEHANEILSTWRAAGVVETAKNHPAVRHRVPGAVCGRASGMLHRGRPRDAESGLGANRHCEYRHGMDCVRSRGIRLIENIGLDIALWHRPVDPWPLISAVAAGLKFLGIAATVIYALCGLAAWIKGR